MTVPDAPQPASPETDPAQRGAARRRRIVRLVGCSLAGLLTAAVVWWALARANSPGPGNAAAVSRPALPPQWEPLRAEAFAAADKLVETYPASARAFCIRASVGERFGDAAQAVADWQAALRLDPQSGAAYLGLGRAALGRGEAELSLRLLHRAAELPPPSADTLLLLARAQSQRGQLAEAEANLHAYTRMMPQSATGFVRLGELYLRQSQVTRAAEYFQAALEIDPRCAAAYRGLERIAAQSGQTEHALRYRREIDRLSPEAASGSEFAEAAGPTSEPALRNALAFTWTEVGKEHARNDAWEEAVACWQRAAEVAPDAVAPREQLVDYYQKSGRLEETLLHLQELARIEPDNPIHQINLGVVASALGRYAIAETAFLRVQELLPHRPEGYAGLAECYVKWDSHLPEAVALAEKAVELAPVAPHYYVLGLARVRRGDREAGLAALARAAELQPDHPLYANTLSRLRGEP